MLKIIKKLFCKDDIAIHRSGPEDNTDTKMTKHRLELASGTVKVFIGRKVFSRRFKVRRYGCFDEQVDYIYNTIDVYETEESDVYVCAVIFNDMYCEFIEKFDKFKYDKVIEAIKKPVLKSTEGLEGDELWLVNSINETVIKSYETNISMLRSYKKLHLPLIEYNGLKTNEARDAWKEVLVFLGIRETEEWL